MIALRLPGIDDDEHGEHRDREPARTPPQHDRVGGDRQRGQRHRGHEVEVAALLLEAVDAGAPQTGDAEQGHRTDEQPERHRGAPPELGVPERLPRDDQSDDEQDAEHDS